MIKFTDVLKEKMAKELFKDIVNETEKDSPCFYKNNSLHMRFDSIVIEEYGKEHIMLSYYWNRNKLCYQIFDKPVKGQIISLSGISGDFRVTLD